MTNFVDKDTSNRPVSKRRMNFDEKAQENEVKSDLEDQTVNLSDKEKEMLKDNVQRVNF